MTRYAALLRGVNLGGRKLVSAEFRRVLEGLGYEDPQTLLASGNAVFGSGDSASAIDAALEKALARELGLKTEVMVRTGAQLAAVVKANPYKAMAKDDPGRLVVMFLKGEPTAAKVAALREKIVGRETVEAGKGCLYIAYPDGQGRSKLTSAIVDKAMAVTGTARNFNTVRKLVDLTA